MEEFENEEFMESFERDSTSNEDENQFEINNKCLLDHNESV